MATTSECTQFEELAEGQLISTPLGVYTVKEMIARGRCCATYVGEAVPGQQLHKQQQLQQEKQQQQEPPEQRQQQEQQHKQQPAVVALKLYSRHQDYRGSLHREQLVLDAVNGQDNIVQHYCRVQDGQGRDVLVQELLSGTLADVLALHGDDPVSPWFLRTLAMHIATGLQRLHECGLVHGDVKPHNLLWSARAAAWTITDFGLSAPASEPFIHQMYSREYAAPEAVLWNKSVRDRHGTASFQPQPTGPLPEHGQAATWTKTTSTVVPTALSTLLPIVPPTVPSTVTFTVLPTVTSTVLPTVLPTVTSTAMPTVPTAVPPTVPLSVSSTAVPPRPTAASDVWSLGLIVAKAAVRRRLFPDGLPSSEAAAVAAVTSAVASLTATYSALFLHDLTDFITRCVRLRPDERATSSELQSATWRCSSAERPSYTDLLTLPTPVLRLLNVMDPGGSRPATHGNTADELASLVVSCRRFGALLSHAVCHRSGALYLHYAEAVSAETAFQHWQGRTWHHRTLVPTFFPPVLYSRCSPRPHPEPGSVSSGQQPPSS